MRRTATASPTKKTYPCCNFIQAAFLWLCGCSGLSPGRRFAPPWSVEELDACFVVRATSISRMNPAGDRQPSCSAKMRREASQFSVELPTFRLY